MLTPKQKLTKIREMCEHPGSFGWPTRKLADAIIRVVNDWPYMPDEDAPIPYELAHDAVYEEVEDEIGG